MISWSNFSEKASDDSEENGHTSNRKEEMNIRTSANKLDMSYDFYKKHNMHAGEWQKNAIIIKIKILIFKLDRSKCHLLIRKFSHVPFNN